MRYTGTWMKKMVMTSMTLAATLTLTLAGPIDDGPDPFIVDGADPVDPVYMHDVGRMKTPFLVFGSVRNTACDSDVLTIVDGEDARSMMDKGLLEALADCRLTIVEYAYLASSEREMLEIESLINGALDVYFYPHDACDTLAECSTKIEETCKLYGKQAPKFSMLKPYSNTGYKTQMCTGTCGDNKTVVNVTCKLVKPRTPPGQVAY